MRTGFTVKVLHYGYYSFKTSINDPKICMWNFQIWKLFKFWLQKYLSGPSLISRTNTSYQLRAAWGTSRQITKFDKLRKPVNSPIKLDDKILKYSRCSREFSWWNDQGICNGRIQCKVLASTAYWEKCFKQRKNQDYLCTFQYNNRYLTNCTIALL